MNNKNTYWIIAGLLNLFTAILHTVGGQLDLVNPLLDSNLHQQAKTEWLGVWHMVTIILFLSSVYLLKRGFAKLQNVDIDMIKSIGVLYVLFSVPFMVSSVVMKVFAPQWILLLPIGAITLIGLRKTK